jgi:hypothetical protein
MVRSAAAGLCSVLLLLSSATAAAEWTVMVYMCADNGMSEQSYVDLEEMSRVGSSRDVSVIVQVDRAEWDSLPRPIRCRVVPAGLEVLGELPELDMADPQNLIDFVRFGRNSYPARKYCLVLWDHGNGWTAGACRGSGGASPPQTTGILHDYSGNSWMGIASGAFRRAMEGVRRALGRNVELLVLDACLMQMIEVAHDAAGGADLLAGAEDLQPFNGLPYDAVLGVLAADPRLDAREFARRLPELVVESYSGGSQGEEAVTFSSLALDRLEPANEALEELLEQLGTRAGSEPVQAARRAVQTFACEYELPSRFNDNVDIIHLLDLVRPAAPNAAGRALDRFAQAVLATASNDPVLAHARGIAVWFPDNYLALKAHYAEYGGLNWAQRVQWLGFLNCFFGSDDVKPTRPQIGPIRVWDRNAIDLCWSRSQDLAPVTYSVLETGETASVFLDPIESFAGWENREFVLSRDGDRTVFSSGSGDTLNRTLTLGQPIDLPSGGLVSFQVLANTRESIDSSGEVLRDAGYFLTSYDSTAWVRQDSFYGPHRGWRQCRYILDRPGQYRLRFEYRTGPGPHAAGILIDSLSVVGLNRLRTVANRVADTSVCLLNQGRGTRRFAVVATDSFSNRSDVSELADAHLQEHARPYSVPAPVTGDECLLVGDWPDGLRPTVSIYSLAGELVRRFSDSESGVVWDCRNSAGRPVAGGIYLVVVSAPGFRQTGVIALVR